MKVDLKITSHHLLHAINQGDPGDADLRRHNPLLVSEAEDVGLDDVELGVHQLPAPGSVFHPVLDLLLHPQLLCLLLSLSREQLLQRPYITVKRQLLRSRTTEQKPPAIRVEAASPPHLGDVDLKFLLGKMRIGLPLRHQKLPIAVLAASLPADHRQSYFISEIKEI